MNKPISYPLAKLLKEKGFDEPTIDQYYLSNGIYKLKEIKEGVFSNSELEKDGENYGGSNPNFWISAPILMDVVMWLYEKHGIWIMVNNWKEHVLDDDDNILEKTHLFTWFITGEAEERTFNSPIEAYEAGIKYCLEKFI
jgi:hypothetical protein